MDKLPEKTPRDIYMALINEVRVRSHLQDDLFFRSIITTLTSNREIFTQKEMAQILGVDISMIRSWKRGGNIPSPALRTDIFNHLRQALKNKRHIKSS